MNKELFYRVADLIEEHPGSYDQSSWLSVDTFNLSRQFNGEEWNLVNDEASVISKEVNICGTYGCIAGHGAMIANGWKIQADLRYRDFAGPAVDWTILDKDGRPVGATDWHTAGQRAFGLLDSQAMFLFSGGWEPDDGMSASATLRKIADTGEMQGNVNGYSYSEWLYGRDEEPDREIEDVQE